MKPSSWALDAAGDTTHNTVSINTVKYNVKEDLPDIVDHYTVHKKTLTRITVSKIGLEDRRGKKGASAGLGCNVNTMKGTRNSRISSSSKVNIF
ncbi:hypothetical protein WUBG_16889 [Wuchereria bancrofti]|uniref:Uncharacterized protein n=1 Tax=Wuchereria bancrofti TaxID=6293 RepID=J9E5G6_WUCBA|nr:hypothetical protein WUBG_16889 [Wuchereria bancrofti]